MFSYQSNLIVCLVLVTAFVVLHLAQAQSDVSHNNVMKHRYCGRLLAKAVVLACYSDDDFRFERSDQEMAMDDYPYAGDSPLRSRSRASAMMGRFGGAKFRRQIRGIVDECCEKPCSIAELQSYCER